MNNKCVIAVFLFLLFVGDSHAIELLSSETYKVGKGPNRALVLDVDNDGKKEAIISNQADGSITLLKFSKSQNLVSSESYSVGVNPTDVIAFDMNNDNYKDILIANHETNSFHILYNNKNGGFDEKGKKKFNVDTEPHIHTLGAGDFNGDKLPDVVIDSWGKSQLAIYHGSPDGGFQLSPTVVDVSEQPRTNLVVTNIDGDELSDVVTPASRHGGISLVLGKNLTKSKLIHNASNAFFVAAADANLDGNMDVLTVHRGSNFRDSTSEGISLLLGNGKGGFKLAKGFPIKISGAPSSITNGDINGDGLPEFISANYRTNNIAVIFFEQHKAQYQYRLFPVGNRPEGIAVGDIDGDQLNEVIVTNRESDTVNLLRFAGSKKQQIK